MALTRTRILTIAAVVVLVVAAWLDGKSRAVTREVLSTYTVAVTRIDVQSASTANASAATVERESRGPIQRVWRRPVTFIPSLVDCPVGIGVEEFIETFGATESTKETIASQSSTKSQRSLTTTETASVVERIVVRATPAPRWTLSLDADPRRYDEPTAYRARLALRLLGPWQVGAWAGRGAVGVSAGVSW